MCPGDPTTPGAGTKGGRGLYFASRAARHSDADRSFAGGTVDAEEPDARFGINGWPVGLRGSIRLSRVRLPSGVWIRPTPGLLRLRLPARARLLRTRLPSHQPARDSTTLSNR